MAPRSLSSGHGLAASDRRAFIRHPIEIPIQVTLDGQRGVQEERSDDVGQGGLRYRSMVRLEHGTSVRVRIAFVQPAFEARARVAWCEARAGGFDVGVAFVEAADRFTARMIEQVCYIERFRRGQQAHGRTLSPEEAAREWVRCYAAEFPES